MTSSTTSTSLPANRPVFFFDVDNCLYPRSTRVQDLMAELIDKYFVSHLDLPAEAARELHRRYYKDYGLAISGLVKHHQIDPLAYNREVDDALPLDGIIKPDAALRALLQSFDRTKVKLWLFTNAHITHARRVVKLLGVEDCFEGVTFCDYGKQPLIAKPHGAMYEKAERESGVWESIHARAAQHSLGAQENVGGEGEGDKLAAARRELCHFIDDSLLNCRHAVERGWTTVHKTEPEDPDDVFEERGDGGPKMRQVRRMEELKQLFPHLFTAGSAVPIADLVGVNGTSANAV